MEAETTYMQKKNIFNIQYILLAVDDEKMNNLLRVISKYFCKKLYFGYCNLSTYKDIYQTESKVLLDIFNLWSDRSIL